MQLLSEKISGAEGTKLDEDFVEMERVSNLEVTIRNALPSLLFLAIS